MQQHNQAFTLIELLVVVLIIGILAAVAVPQYQVAVGKSRVMSLLPIMRSLLNAQDAYYLANGTYTSDMDELDVAVVYDSKEGPENSGWGEMSYYQIGDKRVRLYRSKHAVVGGVGAVTIDMHGLDDSYAYCYSRSEQGEKICRALGTYDRRGASDEYNVYKIHF